MSNEPDPIPYSLRKRRPDIDQKLPQDRSADEDINAVVDGTIRSEHSRCDVTLGFARFKGHRT